MVKVQRSQSLGRRIVLATLAFSIVFTFGAVAVRTWMAWRSNVAAMEVDLKLIDEVFERALSKAIWDMDRDELQRHVATLSQASPVGSVELRLLRAGRSPEILTHRKEGASTHFGVPSIHHVLTFQPYPGSTEAVGEFTLVGDERVLRAKMQRELVIIVVTQVIQSALLALLILALFNRMVTLHVRHIARHLSEITPDTLHRRLELERRFSQHDELSLLVSGVNQLQGNLSDYLVRQHAAEQDLAAHRDRLAELVDEQTAELRAANAQLQELSRSDPLTGIANRRHFDEMKEAEFRRAKRLGHPMSVLVCDLDFFKRYNDTYGHPTGDRCLQAVADTMRQACSRAGELAARIGGEEFVVLLPSVDLEQATEVAERIRRLLDERRIPHSGSDVAPYVTLSIGVAQLDVDAMAHFDELMQRADQALYRAKALGRNRVAS